MATGLYRRLRQKRPRQRLSSRLPQIERLQARCLMDDTTMETVVNRPDSPFLLWITSMVGIMDASQSDEVRFTVMDGMGEKLRMGLKIFERDGPQYRM